MAKQEQSARRGGRRARRGWKKGAAVAAVVVIAVVVGYFAYRAQADLPGQKFLDQGNLHVQTVSEPHEAYNSTPPTSGPHLPYIAPWGVHTKPITDELQVHNLEDGGVVVQYNCECPELAEKLAGIVRKYDRYVILAPYPTMKSRIALTAWTRLETLDDFDAGRIERFIRAYRGIDHHPR
ncbi:MAG TPA: DUF3105 domain-containing protein [Methylomirabilota bacterium]|nr:DUF3105 domain-containing protein [Methylomirabilota bacterium]